MKNLIIPLITIIIFASGCKKWQHEFPEDGGRSKETPTERLTNKTWILSKVTINEKEYTDSIFQIFGTYQISFSNNLQETTFSGKKWFFSDIRTEKEPFFYSIWTFRTIDSVSILPITSNNSTIKSIIPGYLNYFSYVSSAYKILKLTNDELKITLSTKNGDSIINNHFKLQ